MVVTLSREMFFLSAFTSRGAEMWRQNPEHLTEKERHGSLGLT